MIAAIESLVPNAAFTILTGDVVAHDVWLVNENEVLVDLNTTYSQMATLKLVYPAVGNHDTAPVNAFPPSAIQNPSNTADWAYDTMSADWTTWIGTAAAQSAQDYGSYSIKYPGGNLRIISFNSIFYYTDNFWLYSEPMETDPSGQFAWLINELQCAETARENVWLISHVPSGTGGFFHDYSNTFNQIVERYDATIAALFYGHTHADQFQIAYSDYKNPNFSNAFAMSYITPSMTPTSGNPSFRVYSVDPETFGVLDFTEYIADITSPSYQSGPVWKTYYSAKTAYGPLVTPPLTNPSAELTPAFWHNVTQAFESNDAAFQDYYARKSRGFDVTACTGTCKTNEICELRAAEAQYNCATVSPGVHFTKRDGKEGHGDECEGTKTRAIFQAIAGRAVIKAATRS
jgi:sphingomyelin phosphodiesterase